MNISTLLDHIDSGYMALPEFQRGYVWNRDQVRAFMLSLYRKYPVGGLLVWATGSEGASDHARGDGALAPGVVKLLLDGQQRITSLYGIIRGRPPRFFDGNAAAFTGLYFHLGTESFEFYSAKKMDPDPLWIDVTALMQKGNDGVGPIMQRLSADPAHQANAWTYMPRVNGVLSIRDRALPVEEVTDSVARPDESVLDVVVDIFNRVNSGGTKLSKGDLALARICAVAPDARESMKKALHRWWEAGYHFNLDWLLRSVNTILEGEAKFHHLHDVGAQEFRSGLARAEKSIDWLLNAIGERLGLDHDRVLFGPYAFPVMAHYIDRRGGRITDSVERDRLLYWYAHAGMWGRFSGQAESRIDQDLGLIEDIDGGLERLIENLRLERGGLQVLPGHFSGHSLGARFYPVLYLLTRTHSARDWGNGLPLKSNMLGRLASLEVHHIFPKARLYAAGYRRSDVNAVANFCFLTKDSNLLIRDRRPEEYFAEVEAKHPGALASQWVPTDPLLWKLENYLDFLAARRELLAGAANAFLAELLHAPAAPAAEAAPGLPVSFDVPGTAPMGGIDSEEEDEAIAALNAWVVAQGLPEGSIAHELADDTGRPEAILDLAWPDGLQPGLSQPVAVLLNEGPETLAIANRYGYRYFTSVADFRQHVETDVLALGEVA